MIPPDKTQLMAFAAKKGKLIVYHGTADPVFSSNDTARWYRELSANVPGRAELRASLLSARHDALRRASRIIKNSSGGHGATGRSVPTLRP
jgi:hypothetical protein